LKSINWWDYHICNFLNPSKKLAEPQGYKKILSLTKSNLTYPKLGFLTLKNLKKQKNIFKEPRGFVEPRLKNTALETKRLFEKCPKNILIEEFT
jgi:hypothetical protein